MVGTLITAPGASGDSNPHFVSKADHTVPYAYGTARLGRAAPGTACQVAFADYRLDLGEKEFEKNKLLSEITAIVGVRSEDGSGLSGSLTLFGFGGGLGRARNKSVKVGEITNDRSWKASIIS